MTPVTHALLPVFIFKNQLPPSGPRPSWRWSSAVAFAGILPDVLSPHLALEARHASFSHSIWAFLIALLALAIASRLTPKRLPPLLAALLAGAYGLHLLCDALSGGVALAYPATGKIYGAACLPFHLWIVSDLLLCGYAYYIFRWKPLRQKITRRPTA